MWLNMSFVLMVLPNGLLKVPCWFGIGSDHIKSQCAPSAGTSTALLIQLIDLIVIVSGDIPP